MHQYLVSFLRVSSENRFCIFVIMEYPKDTMKTQRVSCPKKRKFYSDQFKDWLEQSKFFGNALKISVK